MPTGRLFEPLQVGNARLEHRIVLAPLTRFRADEHHNPSEHAKTYYEQRGSVPGTLLITEATFISSQAGGYESAPGIWSDSQIAGWKDTTDAVHRKGSVIYLQLWALGRVAQAKVLEKSGGYRVRSASAIAIPSGSTTTGTAASVPEALTEDEIRSFIHDYAVAAKNAIKAGFDGVEIHAANGYLIDQFSQDVSNQRTDAWGGSVEKRSRFGLEVTKAVVEAVGSKRVGIRLSPWYNSQGMGMKDPLPQFTHLIVELKKFDLAYLHLIEARVSGTPADSVYKTAEAGAAELEPYVKAWGDDAPLILAGGYTPEKAKAMVENHFTSGNIAIAFGRLFISTPDLPFRLQHGIELNDYDRPTFYAPGPGGYTDYPFSEQFLAQQNKL